MCSFIARVTVSHKLNFLSYCLQVKCYETLENSFLLCTRITYVQVKRISRSSRAFVNIYLYNFFVREATLPATFFLKHIFHLRRSTLTKFFLSSKSTHLQFCSNLYPVDPGHLWITLPKKIQQGGRRVEEWYNLLCCPKLPWNLCSIL